MTSCEAMRRQCCDLPRHKRAPPIHDETPWVAVPQGLSNGNDRLSRELETLFSRCSQTQRVPGKLLKWLGGLDSNQDSQIQSLTLVLLACSCVVVHGFRRY